MHNYTPQGSFMWRFITIRSNKYFLTFMFTMATTVILKMSNPKCTSQGLKIALARCPGLPFLAAGLPNFVRRKAWRTSTYKIYPPINFTYIDEMMTFLHKSKFPMINIATIKTITNQNCFLLWSDVFYPLANEVAKGYSNATVRPSHPCEHSRINILQWILTKLGTYKVLKRIWNPIDFQSQRSRSLDQIFTA